MSNLILAFILGVIVGMGYMYLRYRKRMLEHIKTLEELKLNGAKIDGMLQVLNTIHGIEEDKCT